MKIYLVRHAQAMWQLDSAQSLDSSLTALGHDQAKRLAQWLLCQQQIDQEGRIIFNSLCVSPLKRAQETAAYVSAALELPAFIKQELREADFHVADHLPQRESPRQSFPPYQCSPVYAAFKSQSQAALDGLIEQAECGGGPVLAVTHGGVIKTILRLIAGSDAICFRLYNAALNLIEWKRGRWHIVHLNQWDHLPAELRTL